VPPRSYLISSSSHKRRTDSLTPNRAVGPRTA
jgi:hypothetical protein